MRERSRFAYIFVIRSTLPFSWRPSPCCSILPADLQVFSRAGLLTIHSVSLPVRKSIFTLFLEGIPTG